MPCSSSSFSKSQVQRRAGWQSAAHPFAGRISIPGCVVFLSDGPWRGNGPRASGMPPTHDGGRQEKDRDWHGTVYGVLREGGKALIPALPRFLPRATLLWAAPPGGFIQKMSPSHTHTFCPYHYGLQGSSMVIVCRPAGARKIAELRRTWGRLRSSRFDQSGGRVIISKRVLSSARRVDQSGVRPRAGQGDRQSVTTRTGELALRAPFPVWSLVAVWRRPRPCSLRCNQDTVAPVCLRLDKTIL